MQIGGLSDSSMIYQQYAEMARQRRLGGAVGMEETDEVQDAAEVNYVAAMEQAGTQQVEQAYEISPSMEVGDRASERGNANPEDMYRMLAASGQGYNPASSPEIPSASEPASASAASGAAGSGSTFWNEILKSFSDVGAYSNAMRSRVNSAYGM